MSSRRPSLQRRAGNKDPGSSRRSRPSRPGLPDAVPLPDREPDRLEAPQQRRQAARHAVIDAQFVDHRVLPSAAVDHRLCTSCARPPGAAICRPEVVMRVTAPLSVCLCVLVPAASDAETGRVRRVGPWNIAATTEKGVFQYCMMARPETKTSPGFGIARGLNQLTLAMFSQTGSSI